LENFITASWFSKQPARKISLLFDVFDRYDKKDSTKSAERERRSSSNPGKVFQIIEGRSIPEWRTFLCTSENKQGLVSALIHHHGK
jgi:hypothetical protein